MSLSRLLTATAACCIGAVVMLEVWAICERELRFRSVMRTFAATREVRPNVGRSDDPCGDRARAGID
jgi:hypothetical protein